MNIPAERIEDVRTLMALFEEPGTLDGGGVTRLGYGPAEDRMHEIFRDWGETNGFIAYTDAVGNSFLENDAATAAAEEDRSCVLVGSHLDSVVRGGRFDGVAGVVAGMACLKWLKESGTEIPLRVAPQKLLVLALPVDIQKQCRDLPHKSSRDDFRIQPKDASFLGDPAGKDQFSVLRFHRKFRQFL